MKMGNTQLTPQQLEALLKFASSKLGVSQEQLARTVQTGDINGLGLSPDNAAKLNGLLGNHPQALLQSPQVQALLAQILGGQKD